MLGNLHTHTEFSDGTSSPEAYIEEAERLGFSVLGFSDHSPVPFPNTFAIPEGGLRDYVEAIQKLASQQSAVGSLQASGIRHPASNHPVIQSSSHPVIQILLGLEYDYIPGLTVPLSQLREEYPFDYMIGSVHLVQNDRPDLLWFIDGPQTKTYDKGLRDVFGGDIRKAVTAYWKQLQEMVMQEKPDIIGHFDKIKMHNHDRYFREEESWYHHLAVETLELIRQQGAVVEVNTRGLYKKRSDSLFPGAALLKEIGTMKIPVTISSDAHQPEELSLGFEEAKSVLKESGVKSHWLLDRTGWREISL
ncbi:MAG: histidinol-phosphatase [Bacteroidales bacterium]|nr:histidinol-phosphatase [Bacteroidales bacterium]